MNSATMSYITIAYVMVKERMLAARLSMLRHFMIWACMLGGI